MKALFSVTFFSFLIRVGLLCCFAPWTTARAGSAAAHDSLGYAAIWSSRFGAVPGARVDPGAFAMLAGVVLFFAMVIGASAYFPRAERKDV
jgi:hypothetical protein